MAISVIIIVLSTALFLYWFRYTCVLILRTRNARDYALRVAEVNRLSFIVAREKLTEDHQGQLPQFEGLHQSLDRDYRVVCYLLQHTGTQSGQSMEEHMLRIDYQIMRACYFLTKPFSAASARHALLERASIIGHLANAMGQRAVY